MCLLQKLINKVKIAQFEYKTINEIAFVNRGNLVYTKKYIEKHPGIYPVYSSQTKNHGIKGSINSFDYDGEYITWTTGGAYAGTVFYHNEKFNITVNSGLIKVKSQLINTKYFFYVLKKILTNHVRVTNLPVMLSNKIKKIIIPIPKIKLQIEIIKAMDQLFKSSNDLIDKLSKELVLCKKQHDFYENFLLNFNNQNIKFQTIDTIAKIYRGKIISQNFIKKNLGIYPVYSSQTKKNGIIGKISTYDYDGEYITWTTDGSYAGTVFYRSNKFSITNACGLIAVFDKKIIIKYLYYFLRKKTFQYVRKTNNFKLINNQIKKILIPIIVIKKQKQLVAVLDQLEKLFEKLIFLISSEINARKKQLQYYFEKIIICPII